MEQNFLKGFLNAVDDSPIRKVLLDLFGILALLRIISLQILPFLNLVILTYLQLTKK